MSELETPSNVADPPSPKKKPTGEEIQSKLAKIKGLQLLQTGNRVNRDGNRLQAQVIAVRKKQGIELAELPGDFNMVADDIQMDQGSADKLLQMAEEDGMGDINLVADNITIGQDKKESTAPPSNGGTEDNTTPAPEPIKEPTKPNDTSLAMKIAPWILATGALTYAANRDTPAPAPNVDRDTRIAVELEGGVPFVPIIPQGDPNELPNE